MALRLSIASASFAINTSGGPGLIHYQLTLAVAAAEWPSVDMTVHKLEQWALGADGSEYNHTIVERSERIGCGTGTSAFSGSLLLLNHEFTARPIARTYRARIEYTYDTSPATVYVVTAEKEIESNISFPLMTSLAMTADAPVAPTLISLRPITFVAAGTGGITPYEYQFRLGNNVILRDWSRDARFVWDPGANAISTNMTALGRSTGRTDAEVMKSMTFYLTK